MNSLPGQKVNKINRINSGFSFIEMILVIGIITTLMVLIIILVKPMERINYAKTESAKAQIKALSNAIEAQRVTLQKTMLQITGNVCTACSCNGGVDARTDTTCINAANASWAKISTKPMSRDPWGNTFTFEENELEFNNADCRYDQIISPGPNHTRGDADDIIVNVTHFSCPP